MNCRFHENRFDRAFLAGAAEVPTLSVKKTAPVPPSLRYFASLFSRYPLTFTDMLEKGDFELRRRAESLTAEEFRADTWQR